MTNKRDLRADITWGVGWSALVATFIACVAMVQYALGGERAFEANDTTFDEVIGFYTIGAVIAGVIVGLLRPMMKTLWGAGATGFLVALPVYVACRVIVLPEMGPLDYHDAMGMVFFGLVLGLPVGVIYWYQTKDYRA